MDQHLKDYLAEIEENFEFHINSSKNNWMNVMIEKFRIGLYMIKKRTKS